MRGGRNENENKHNKIKENARQESHKLGSRRTSLVNTRLTAEVNIRVLSAEEVDKETLTCQRCEALSLKTL